jgi:hypothetical protein
MEKTIRTEKDPILLRSLRERVELRIRKYADHGTRVVYLKPTEARKLAIALLQVAEKTSNSN